MIQGVRVAMETHLRFSNDDQERVLDWAWKLHAKQARQFIVKNRARKNKSKEGEDHTKELIMKGFGQNI